MPSQIQEKSQVQQSKLLQDLRADLMVGRIEDTYELAGHRFRMHTLSDGEAIWRDTFVSVASNMAFLATRKTAALAAAISHVDDHPVADLFVLPDDEQLAGFLKNNEKDRRDFYRERMLEYLSGLEDVIVGEMSNFLGTLEERRAEVLKNLKNSSRGTGTSPSSSTSLPADGPPAVPGVVMEAPMEPTRASGSSFAP